MTTVFAAIVVGSGGSNGVPLTIENALFTPTAF